MGHSGSLRAALTALLRSALNADSSSLSSEAGFGGFAASATGSVRPSSCASRCCAMKAWRSAAGTGSAAPTAAESAVSSSLQPSSGAALLVGEASLGITGPDISTKGFGTVTKELYVRELFPY